MSKRWKAPATYDAISSVAYWYQTEPHNPFLKLPERDFLEDNEPPQ